ncbi:MAG: transcriptional regulator [Bacteroidetes bacterium B1(2017)]|nr:MAG: transcriptional regulator [Bacteroidetes bacterium B1(2017)]
MKIQMVDLKSQYEKIKNEVDSGIQEVINNTQFIKGPQIKVFEDNLASYLGVRNVIACANGTDALQIAMMALGLKPGDEIILPVFTYVATAEVIALLGLVPVMVDVDAETFCIDTNLIESKISVRTKAIVPVHLFGQCANMDEVMRIASKHNLFVIEDTAQAIGAKYRVQNSDSRIQNGSSQEPDARCHSAGCIGTVGTTSFFPSKNLGCYGDGGALMTNDDELAKKIRMICNHGQSVQYVHDEIGVNSRLDSIQAAVLNAKLPHLKEYENSRNQAANWYDELLGDNSNLIIPKRNQQSTHVFHQYTLKIVGADRNLVRKKLAEKGIPSMVYYPIELHKQKAFEKYHSVGDTFAVSEQLCQTVLSLPMHTEMTREMVEYVCAALIECLK